MSNYWIDQRKFGHTISRFEKAALNPLAFVHRNGNAKNESAGFPKPERGDRRARSQMFRASYQRDDQD